MRYLDRKGVRPLLRQVGNRAHASDNDHEPDGSVRDETISSEPPMPTPPDSARSFRRPKRNSKDSLSNEPAKVDEEDFNREPDESSSEAASEMGGVRGGAGKSKFKKAEVLDFKEPKDDTKRKFQTVKTTLPPSSPEKKQLGDSDLERDTGDDEIFADVNRKVKRAKFNNVHALPSKKSANVFVKPRTFGSQDRRRDERAKEKAKKDAFKKASARLESPKPKSKFVKHELPAMQFGGFISSQGSASDFATLCGANNDRPARSSSPLSSLSSEPDLDPLNFDCETCGQRVSKLLREEYEDKYVNGRQWTMKRQERFCEWHRRQSADETWKERGYPAIEWTGLTSRMRKHDSFLIDVVNDEVRSQHRADFKKQSRSRGMKNGFKSNAKPGAFVGYYGPKGEKMMSNHIIQHLSTTLRQRASKDQLVASSGYQGGVSGFVQAVLVPHLAELLVKDDMKLTGQEWETKAREIITESVEIGELMYPEVEDQIVEVDDAEQ